MLKTIGLAFVAALAALAVIIVTRPDSVSVERSAVIDAPADITYGLVSDFHGWTQWSPWEALDPAMKRTYEGAPSGTGALYSWVGNDQVGSGRMSILEAQPGERVDIKLEFIKPFESTNQTLFTFKPEGGKTTVTWTMNSKLNFMMKGMSLFKSMDAMIGPDFERGLAKLKTVAEAQEQKRVAEAAAAKLAAEEAAAKQAAEAAAAAAAAAPPAAATGTGPTTAAAPAPQKL